MLADATSGGNEVAYLLSALGTLAAIIGVFWRIIYTNHRETKERSDTLEIKLDETQKEFGAMREEMGELKGRVTLAEEIAPKLEGIELLVGKVLVVVSKEDQKGNES